MSSSNAISRPKPGPARPGWRWSPTSPMPGSTMPRTGAFCGLAADGGSRREERAADGSASRSASRRGPTSARPQEILSQAQADLALQRTAFAQDVNALQLLVGAPVDPACCPTRSTRLRQHRGASRRPRFRLYSCAGPTSSRPSINCARPMRTSAPPGRRCSHDQPDRPARLRELGADQTVHRRRSRLERRRRRELHDLPGRRGPCQRSLERSPAARRLATYQRAIQTAFREVADALARRGTINDEIAARQRQQAAAADTYLLTEARYRAGIDPFLTCSTRSGPITPRSRRW